MVENFGGFALGARRGHARSGCAPTGATDDRPQRAAARISAVPGDRPGQMAGRPIRPRIPGRYPRGLRKHGRTTCTGNAVETKPRGFTARSSGRQRAGGRSRGRACDMALRAEPGRCRSQQRGGSAFPQPFGQRLRRLPDPGALPRKSAWRSHAMPNSRCSRPKALPAQGPVLAIPSKWRANSVRQACSTGACAGRVR